MKKIRFGELVRSSGRPKMLTLWTAPAQHKELNQAIRDNRVLTVHRSNVGNKRDVGEIGFHQKQDAFYLVFPRRLPDAGPEPVIGINYDLLEEPATSASAPIERARPAPPPVARAEHKIIKLPPPPPSPSPAPPSPTSRSPESASKDLARRFAPAASAPVAIDRVTPAPSVAPQRGAMNGVRPPQPKAKKFKVTVRATAETEIEIEATSEKEARAQALKKARESISSSTDWRHTVVRVKK